VIVLVHSGVTDSRMWDGFELPGAVRHELRGFGETPLPAAGEVSHAEDLEAALGGEPSTLVGASFGGQVCLEVAARRPELVTDLVVMGAPLPEHEWSPEVLAYADQEEALIEQGDFRGAAELGADFWLEDSARWDAVVSMQERAYVLQAESEAEESEPREIDLSAVRSRTLVIVGELDKPDFHQIAERLVAEIDGARLARVEGAGHLPALERPAETSRLIREFLLADRI
jgi:3-oxoadipate enol-lactonase